MKLERIVLAQWRRFRDGLVLDGLSPGLNLYSGPNEAGKSSIVRALRAAFFERHRSTAVEDLRPWGDSTAAPSVELAFEHAGTHYRLRKSFLQRKRCELEIRPAQGPVRALDGEAAEQHLAELLGFRQAAKGASRPEHWGIPGLLWIEQGRVQDLHEPLGHAHEPLRRVLESALGPIASTEGDDVMRRLQAARDELLTSTGKPRAAFAEARAEQERLQQALDGLDARIAQYREQVDQLGRLAAEAARDEAEAPWASLRAKVATARQRLAEAEAQGRQRDADRERLRQAEATRALVEQQLAQAARREAELLRRRAAATASAERLAQARAHEARQQAAQAATIAAREQAAVRLEQVREAAQAAERARAQREADLEAARLDALILRAEAAATQRDTLQARLAALPLEAALLERWRQLASRRQQREATAAAIATRLTFDLTEARGVLLDGEPVPAQGERRLTSPAGLSLPGLGTIRIVPGGGDLAALQQELAALDAEDARLRHASGLTTLADAEHRQRLRQELQALAQAAQATLAALAPQGLDALRQSRRALPAPRDAADPPLAASAVAETHARTDATANTAADATADADPAAATAADLAPMLADAERQQAEAQARERAGAITLAEARQALAAADAEHAGATRELAWLEAERADPERQRALEAAALQARTLQAECDALAARLADQEAALRAARPDVLQQDIERWTRSAEQLERTAHDRQMQLTLLRGKLDEAGAHGLEEARGERAAELASAQRRVAELAQRAAALELLLQLLAEQRLALTRQLHAPLQRHLQRGLDLLWPGTAIELGEDLSPQQIVRPGPRGTDAAAFDELSYGAREQLGLVARIAYADLLREAGRPTLLILDDVLVHSDHDRLGRMKRVLYDAAARHQVLLFTCHPDAWRDLGAPVQPLDTLPRAPA